MQNIRRNIRRKIDWRKQEKARRERQCAMKVRYRTKRKALRKKGAVAYGKGMHAYMCKYCGWWHLGHSTKRK